MSLTGSLESFFLCLTCIIVLHGCFLALLQLLPILLQRSYCVPGLATCSSLSTVEQHSLRLRLWHIMMNTDQVMSSAITTMYKQQKQQKLAQTRTARNVWTVTHGHIGCFREGFVGWIGVRSCSKIDRIRRQVEHQRDDHQPPKTHTFRWSNMSTFRTVLRRQPPFNGSFLNP